MPADSPTIAAKVFAAAQLAARFRVQEAAPVVLPLCGDRSDGWRYLVGCFSYIRPAVAAACPHGHTPRVQFATDGGAGGAVLARIATPFLAGDRATAAARWSAAFDNGLAPDVLGTATAAVGTCLRARFPAVFPHTH